MLLKLGRLSVSPHVPAAPGTIHEENQQDGRTDGGWCWVMEGHRGGRPDISFCLSGDERVQLRSLLAEPDLKVGSNVKV